MFENKVILSARPVVQINLETQKLGQQQYYGLVLYSYEFANLALQFRVSLFGF